jgi:leader peptidase (prepilin peptidase)/N-methyltransferase
MQDGFLLILETEFPALILIIGALFGLIIGSFLNVVIYRLPLMLEQDWKNQAQMILDPERVLPPTNTRPFNLIFPNSHCPCCDYEIRWWENIPVISYLFLRGKCSNCGVRISVRYPLIETLTAVITCILLSQFGLTIAGGLALVLSWCLICLAMIDYDHQLLPDNITLPLLWLGLIANSFTILVDFRDAFWGAVAGYMLLWLLYWAFKLITGKDGMGYGDFKLLAVLGAWMGWQSLPTIIILSSLSGAIIGGTLILFGRDRRQPIPFGPYLAIAGWITLVWQEQIENLYYQFVLSGM